jgi:hypothetical protein
MADVFISYAKVDRPLALKLAAMLEAEGWKTWWDTSLTIGDDFRNEIMTELGRARAVIVIWTDASIKSDWVRSEAGRAQADRKLIPVKLEHLTYKDLPPPFDVLHTENIGEEDKIRAAVVAQLAKPAVEPSPWALLTKGFKYEVLTWFGIVGGALTLFTAIAATLVLAPWAQWLVDHWRQWTHAFWLWAFGWLGIYLPPEWTPVLSFLLFGSLLTISQAVQFSRTTKTQSITFKFDEIFWVAFAAIIYFVIISETGWRPFLHLITLLPSSIAQTVLLYMEYGLVPLIMSLWFLVKEADHKLHAGVTIWLMAIFWIIITLNNLIAMQDSKGFVYFTAVTTIIVLPVILLSVAPAKAVSRRLVIFGIGLLLLIALNELSKLGANISWLIPPR